MAGDGGGEDDDGDDGADDIADGDDAFSMEVCIYHPILNSKTSYCLRH